MTVWILFALLAAATAAVLVRPLLASPPRTAAAGSAGMEDADTCVADTCVADMAVYRDQLASLDAERDAGLLNEAEAAAARAEIGRRLLQKARETSGTDRAGAAERAPPRAGVRWTAYVLAAAIPVASLGLYWRFGSPGLPDLPYAARAAAPAAEASIEDLVARVEERLRQVPADGRGWDVIAPVYMLQRRYEDAAGAYAKALALLGETPKRLAGLAEARLRAANGVVDAGTRRAFERLLVLDPSRSDARFWLAMGREQDGDKAGAAAGYRALLAGTAADDPWAKATAERLAALEKEGKAAPSGAEAMGTEAAGRPSAPEPAPEPHTEGSATP